MKKLLFLSLFLSFFFTSCVRPRMVEEPPLKKEAETPKKWKALVVVDAGHGGKDLGTHREKPPRYQEKELTLKTALYLEEYLKKLGYRVVMTRSEDIFIPLEQRAEIANDLRAKAFVSVHYNSATSTTAQGVEVFYYESTIDKKRSQASKELGKKVIETVTYETLANSRGVKHGNYAVLRETVMPAVIVEGGFLTNVSERDRLLQNAYLKKVARGIAHGIDDYFMGTTCPRRDLNARPSA